MIILLIFSVVCLTRGDEDFNLEPGKTKVITSERYDSGITGEGEFYYKFTGKKGYEILASCDDVRPSVDYINPCAQFNVTFDDGEKKKTFCSALWLTEVYFTTKNTKLNFHLTYNFTVGAGLFRCFIRTTEPYAPTQNLTVPSKIDLFKRSPLQEDIYSVQNNGKPFNVVCKFMDTENAFCTRSRVIVTTNNEEMFCLGREFRRQNVKKATVRVFADGKGWPEIYCSFTNLPTAQNTPEALPYSKPRLDRSGLRKQPETKLSLKGGETKEISFNSKDHNKIQTWNVDVSEGHNVYVFCSKFHHKNSYDPTFPCDPFKMTLEESGRIAESWCSTRHLESLGYLSKGSKLKVTVEYVSTISSTGVTCAIRSTEPPGSSQTMTLTKASPNAKIEINQMSPYMVKRWIVKHSQNGQITVICGNQVFPEREYRESDGNPRYNTQYYCYARRIEVNKDFKCERRDSLSFNVNGEADIIVMSDQKGVSGHICDVMGTF